jgi:hypothetical protein
MFLWQQKIDKAATSISVCSEQIRRSRFRWTLVKVHRARYKSITGSYLFAIFCRILEASSKERLTRKPLLPFEVEKICHRYTSDLLDLSDLDYQLKTLDKRFRRVEIPDA